MSLHSELPQLDGIINRLMDSLNRYAKIGLDGAALRQQTGFVLANYPKMLDTNTFGAELLKCFTIALAANITLDNLVFVHTNLFNETPTGFIAKAVVQASILICLSSEVRIISVMEFVSRDDVDIMIARMKLAFDQARDLAADTIDSASYQALTFLGGSLFNFLAKTARPLPRMITFNLTQPLPAMALSLRIYGDPLRWEEVIAENKTIHPLFCQRTIIGLSA